jgi:phosphoglycerol transferase MdoB-like AlkP superfamily enzyme
VPIAFYSPDVNLKQVIDTAKIIQHIDLYPTILSLMGINDTVFSFGDDILKRKTIGVNYLNGIYQFIIEENLIRFDGEKIIDCYRYKNDSLLKNNILKQLPEDTIIKYTKTAQAIIQTYDESLLNNKMTVSEP